MTSLEALPAVVMKKLLSYYEWLNQSIYHRVTFAMIALTLSILLIFGLLSYGFTRYLVRKNVHMEFESNCAQTAQRLEYTMNELIESISNLSTNLLVTNAIVDTFGRDSYILPFIKSYKSEHGIAIELTLCDFMGKPIASNGNNPHTFNSAKLLTRTIEEGNRFAELENHRNGKTLLMAFPVIWAMTNQAEGILVAKVNMDELFHKTLPSFDVKSDQRMVLMNGQTTILQTSKRAEASSFQMRVPLKLQPPLDQMAFQLEIYDYRKIQARWLAGIYLIAGLLFIAVTMRVSKAISLMVLGRLMVVSDAAKRISESGSIDFAPEVGGSDEVTTLWSAFNAMIGKVQERTKELNVVNDQLRQEVIVRKQAEMALKESEAKLRDLSHKLLDLREIEREELSWELQESLAQKIIALKMHLRIFEQKLPPGDEALREEYRVTLMEIDDIVENLRRRAADLSPQMLEDLGLNAGLKNLCTEYGINCSFTMDELDQNFTFKDQVSIYRVIEEAMGNISQHAQASHVTVIAKRVGNQVEFLVEDNGQGFDVASIQAREVGPKGIGLPSISERIRALGGTFTIESQPAVGTRIFFSIPRTQDEDVVGKIDH